MRLSTRSVRRARPTRRLGRARGAAFAAVVVLAATSCLTGCTDASGTTPPGAAARSTPGTATTGAWSPGEHLVSFARDGSTLVGTLTVPEHAADERVPLVIVMHGFGDNRDGVVAQALAEALTEVEAATLRFDFDGHGDSDGELVDMTIPEEIEDARAAYRYARELDFVSTIGLAGASQGGVVASMLAGELTDDVGALALFAAAGNLQDSLRAGRMLGATFDPDNPPEHLDVYGSEVGRDYLRSGQTIPLWDTAARFAGPALVLQGDRDDIVPVATARRYHSVLVGSELRVVAGENHSFSRDPAGSAALAARFLSDALRS